MLFVPVVRLLINLGWTAKAKMRNNMEQRFGTELSHTQALKATHVAGTLYLCNPEFR